MREFKDKVALVTGAASGIGFALADRFASVGMKVVLADVEESALQAAERTLRGKGAPVLAVRTDVADAASVEALAERAYERFGAVHVLCNNAGVGVGGLTWEHSLEDWRWVLGVNLWGVIHGVRSFVPRMLAQASEGHIVNTASVAGLVTAPHMAIYEASKHAVVALTETLRMDLELTGSLLRASVLCPGFVQTRISDSERNRPTTLAGPERPADPVQTQMRELARAQIAAGISSSEVAAAVLEAIRDDHFWVLTHPRFKKVIRLRMEGILEGTPPRFELPG
ncbi:MAG: SDR family NAD(P)-dependent oxidoreductase [Deltaproteobacteria bacterium]|nr:SDR family NAD(P)-dependent oxidoreductase [Deltaproteobacteria bacterium]